MAATVSPDLATEVIELKKRIEQMETVRSSVNSVLPPPAEVDVPVWLKVVNIGTILTVVLGIIGFAYYLGGLNNTVSSTSLRLERLEISITGSSRDSITSRMAIMETRLEAIDHKIDSIDKKLDKLSEK